ncbi:Dyp-type peroxidase [Methylorubrum extorquens]|uniref:Dyp-type peroxidase family n=1 Tax=Methylorubrum extorquens DSM 13060 TaxID=882800 RepID=H1KH30_METEX|nr:peroxidase [Methylorubrum extorquens]EHP93193.1 Dyp-type peroxidase family [Methylorubrum extorquens DSM 13060]
MAIDITEPLSWKKADSEELLMLQGLQGNILKGHGRHFTANLFFRLDPARSLEARRLLRELANFHIVSAYRQLIDADTFKKAGKKRDGGRGAGAFVHVALSAAGYEAIGRGDVAPADPDFALGMGHPESIAALQDPSIETWEREFRTPVHGVVIAAHETPSSRAKLAAQIRELIHAAGGTVFIQHGAALFNAAGEGIEHFGYVDGRSQPLMLIEDIEAERKETGTDRWDPAFPLGLALVPDPGVPDDPTAFGSYLVFRKLEQRVRSFKLREQVVADQLDLMGADERELAGALIVGRFEDGTPVTLSPEARALKPGNNFDYTADAGSRCPFHAHIRKTDPRGSGGAEPEAEERSHLMPRRGIPYEDARREVHPAELPEADSLEEFQERVADKLPKNGVGLLFMAYNSKIAHQFAFTQAVWANNTNFPLQPTPPHGVDPVIGQGLLTAGEQKLPRAWDDPTEGVATDVDFGGFVHMKGGEYFFSPSLTFLRNL